ncbi:MAG: TonB-dependent receptor [Terriglobia bacterium]
MAAAAFAFAGDRGQIAGVVTGKDRTGIGGVTVTLTTGGAESGSTISDEQGRFRFDNLKPGTYAINYALGDGTADEPSVAVRAGETTSVATPVTFDFGKVATITVYSASRQRERLIDAPAAVSSVSDTDVRLYAASGAIPNAIAALPGVTSGQAGLFDYNLNVRGMNTALNRRIQTLVDGRDPSIMFLSSQDWAALSVMTDDLEPIEMLRGPSGALYGANSFNGVISIRTKDARDNPGGTLRVSFGDPAQYKAEALWATALGNGYYLKLTGGFNRAESFAQSRNSTVEYPGIPMESIPLSTRTTDVSAGAARIEKYFSNGRNLSLEGGAASMDGLLLLTSTGRSFADGLRTWSRFHLEDSRWDVLGWSNTRRSDDVAGLGSGTLLTEHENAGGTETRYRRSVGKNRFVAGVDYAVESVNTANSKGIQTLLSQPVLTNKGAVFGQMDRKVTEALSLELSGQVDLSTLHSPQFSPRVAAVYAISPSHSVRVSYNEGFQVASHIEFFVYVPAGPPLDLSAIAGAVAPLTGNVSLGLSSVPLIAQGNPNLLVEHNRTLEFGYKTILRKQGFFAVNYYHSWMSDFISDAYPGANPAIPRYKAPASLPAAVQGIVAETLNGIVPGLSNLPDGAPYIAISLTNAGRVQSEGVEAEISSQVLHNWQVGANYSYFNFKPGEQASGTQVHPNAPRHTGVVFGGFRSARLNADLRLRRVEHMYWANGLYTGPVPGYSIVDLAGMYDVTRHYKLGIQVDNLLNNAHYEVFGGDILKRRVLGYVAYTW